VAAFACAPLFASACRTSPPPPPGITLTIPEGNASAAFVEVRNLPSADLAALRSREMSRDEWTAILRVSVAGDRAPDRPPFAGAYAVTGDALRFTPMFPFDPGRRYEVRYEPPRAGADTSSAGSIVDIVSLPKADVAPSTTVAAIYPTSDTIPENQLRFYVAFSAPMGLKGGLEYIHLLDEAGREVKDPFLPLDAEFWNGDRTRYTVFVDPGRVKRGVLPNEQMGRSLTSGRKYAMVVDRDWRDAQGLPLKESYRREFGVRAPDERPLSTSTWTIAAPARETRDPLVVTFPEPLDHGLLQRALGVARAEGQGVMGEVTIDRQETRWSFTPRDPWRQGSYKLVVLTILEDLAGNRIGRAFEVDQFDRVDRSTEPDSIDLAFRIP
jgi:hypothetical protein